MLQRILELKRKVSNEEKKEIDSIVEYVINFQKSEAERNFTKNIKKEELFNNRFMLERLKSNIKKINLLSIRENKEPLYNTNPTDDEAVYFSYKLTKDIIK